MVLKCQMLLNVSFVVYDIVFSCISVGQQNKIPGKKRILNVLSVYFVRRVGYSTKVCK